MRQAEAPQKDRPDPPQRPHPTTVSRFGANLGETLAAPAFYGRIYLAYAAQNLKIKLSYPWDFFVNLLGTATYGVLNVIFLWVLLQKTDAIAGWTFPELIFLYGVGEFCFGLFSIFFFHMVSRFSEHYLVEGNLDRLLVRPLPALLQLMMESLDMFDVVILLKGGALIGWAWANLPLDVAPLVVLRLVSAIVLGTAVYLGIFLSATSLSFWLPDRGGLLMPLFSLSDASRYPLTAYPLGIRLFFSYVVPFAFVAFYPAVWALDKGPLADGVLQSTALAAAVSCGLGWLLFTRGLARYESTGT
ncbi:MAG: hypothetical protein C4523_12585 [Myxococcales bacterium]|nr:MAG: hypothetical protein C4523_12585 [Myxococcales bacterium]